MNTHETKTSPIQNLLQLSAQLLLIASLVGCAAIGNTVRVEAPTLGKQLEDLKKSKDSGVITEKDYEEQKAKLLEKK